MKAEEILGRLDLPLTTTHTTGALPRRLFSALPDTILTQIPVHPLSPNLRNLFKGLRHKNILTMDATGEPSMGPQLTMSHSLEDEVCTRLVFIYYVILGRASVSYV